MTLRQQYDTSIKSPKDIKTGIWHTWFAWYPVRLDTGKWRWLVKVGRLNYTAVMFSSNDAGRIVMSHRYWRRHCNINDITFNKLKDE